MKRRYKKTESIFDAVGKQEEPPATATAQEKQKFAKDKLIYRRLFQNLSKFVWKLENNSTDNTAFLENDVIIYQVEKWKLLHFLIFHLRNDDVIFQKSNFIPNTMRRSTTRRFLVVFLFGGLLTYLSYKVGTSVISYTSLEDIRDRSALQARVQSQLNADRFVVNPKGQACLHPDLDANDPVLAKFFSPSSPIVCDSEPDWVCVSEGKVSECNHTAQKHKQIECTYNFLERVSDFKTNEMEPIHANEGEPVSLRSDFFKVRCEDANGEQWSNIMAGIRKDDEVRRRAGKNHLPNDALGLNVLIWGHDSLSRMTFMRKMPKTYEYITEILGAVVLKGYNIVGDGTPQALIPILTGKTELELPETRKRMGSKAQHVNVYPFVWKDFQDHGYVTGYAEDCPGIGTFTYRLMGFNEQPTDHYMRTFYLSAIEEYSQHLEYCLRATPRHKVMMNWMKEFFTMYADKPKFAFSFHSELSHDNLNKVGSADDDLHQMIYFLQSQGHLNTTLLIIMSDHGHRFSQVRETQQGKQEERLPFFAFVFPPWFEQKYPIAMMNFRRNSERLTTPFDIYPTLYNILHFEGPGKGNVKDRGISLFKEVPLSRTCMDADVEPHWCACLNWKPVDPNEEIVQQAAEALVQHINDITDLERELCEILKLDKIVWAGKFLPTKGLLQFKKNADYDGFVADMSDQTTVSIELYQVQIHTQPGEGHFEASLKYDVTTKTFSIRTTDISRVNKYGQAAECVEETQEQLRKYCYCKTQMT
uniref:DUF229 domain-containing protein n=1 Tax=Strigamia maritima TaxID=126957 RepID=T1IUT3_STRMM